MGFRPFFACKAEAASGGRRKIRGRGGILADIINILAVFILYSEKVCDIIKTDSARSAAGDSTYFLKKKERVR